MNLSESRGGWHDFFQIFQKFIRPPPTSNNDRPLSGPEWSMSYLRTVHKTYKQEVISRLHQCAGLIETSDQFDWP